ncbi:Hsp20/alpha crystallin family protein [Ramlibacter sp. 2FC]|uniref:Hsp20/alpha crystallin family protein n=1 Tax=Ramlibacter sp. 2FC TaxID=2502188 RepID=UPI0010F80DC4|nr:Hsp20/alpha crystallin family protein [Ramlibacter sp. 2FC]
MFFGPVVRTRTVPPAYRSFDRSFERLVNDAWRDSTQRGLDLAQDDKAWTLSLDLPGLAKEELNIGIEGAVVRIASKPEARRQVRAAYELPQDIDAGASSAKLENGVLTLTLAKQPPMAKATQLTVN